MNDVTLKELEELCDTAAELKTKADSLEDEAKEIRKELFGYQQKIQAHLESFDKEDYDARAGNFSIRKRTSVKIPRNEEDKRALFAWLRDKGIFYETVGVNSQTLNSLYKNEFETAIAEGRECVIPGLGEPEIFTQLVIKPKR